MQVLVADNDFSSRVPVETLLRERGHVVKGADDGLEAAKLLASPGAPRLAVLAQDLDRLRGLDICRVLSATGKKGVVYVILVTERVDADLVERARRAGIDDIVCRDFSPAMLSVRVDAAFRSIELEDAFNRVHGVLSSLGALGNPVQTRANELREWNAGFLNKAKGAGPASQSPGRKVASAKAPVVAEALRTEVAASSRDVAPRPATFAETPAPAASLQADDIQPDAGSDNSVSAEEVSVADQASVLAQVEQIQQAEIAEAEEDPAIFPFEFDEIVLAVFSGMGVSLKSQIPAQRVVGAPVFLSWVGVAMPDRGSWIDVLIESTEEGALSIARAVLGQDEVDQNDVLELWSELSNMLQGGLRRYLEDNGKIALQLAIPKARREDALLELPEPSVESGFLYEGAAVNVLLYEHREFKTCTTAGDAQLFDLLCEPVILADGAHLFGLEGGCVLNNDHLQKLAQVNGQTKTFKVVNPSKVARKLVTSTLF